MSRNGKGDSGHAQRREDAGKSQGSFTFRTGPSRGQVLEGGASGRGRAAASKWGWVLERVPEGCAERVAVTFAVKPPCFGE